MRKKLKTEVYKAAKLMPRESDPDFDGQLVEEEFNEAASSANMPAAPMIDKSCFSTLCTKAEDIRTWFDNASPFSVPIMGRQSSAQSINATMLGMFGAINGQGGVLANEKEVPHLYYSKAEQEIARQIRLRARARAKSKE